MTETDTTLPSFRQPPLGPLKLRASLHETIWGGRRLATLAGKTLPPGALIGESWETADDAIVETPPVARHTLAELVARYGEALIGSRAIAIYGRRFPLLTKFLDAQQSLSVQVHPDDDYAHAHEGGKLGKTETWYILHAEPGSQIVYGFNRPATHDEVRQAIAETRLESLLTTVEVHAGEVVFVPAGTVHAIGAGVALYELQEYSDVTYRLYDYGRLQANGQPRELHVDRGLAVLRAEPPAIVQLPPRPTQPLGAHATRRTLVACRYFVEDELRVNGEAELAVAPTSCQILTVLDGECEVAGSVGEPILLAHGDTAVLPATLASATLRSPHESGARLIRSYVPTEDDAALA